MAAPTITLPTTGTDPKIATKESLESVINTALEANYNNITDAMRYGGVSQGTVTGTNALTFTYDGDHAPAAVTEKLMLQFEVVSTSTGPVTISVPGGVADRAVIKGGGGSVGAGEFAEGDDVIVVYDLPGNVWVVVANSRWSSYAYTSLVSHLANQNNPHSVTKAQVGLGNVNNTSDADKPVSTAQLEALNLKAPKDSPSLTGTPTAPTAAKGTDSTQIATTEFVATGLADKLDIATARGNLDIHATVDAASNDNEIILTGPMVPRYPVVGARISFIADRNFVQLVDSGSPFNGRITAQMKDADGNLGGRYNIVVNTNGPASNGMIINRQPYTLEWLGGPGNNYRLSGFGDVSYSKAVQGIVKAVTTTGTANAITVVTDYTPIDRSLLIFRCPINNTGGVTIAAGVAGSSPSARDLRRSDLTPLIGGELKNGLWCVAMYDASGGNPYTLLATGVTFADVQAVADDLAALDTRVTALEAVAGDITYETAALALMEKINGPAPSDPAYATSPRNPDNFHTWSEGVRQLAAPLEFKTLAFSSSIFTELHAGKSPSQQLTDALTNTFSYLRNISFSEENQAVPGSFLNTFVSQIQAATAGDFDIVFGGDNQNSATISAMAGANNFANYRAQIVNVINEGRNVRNGFVIMANTFHSHLSYGQEFADNYAVSWPKGNRTYSVVNQSQTFAANSGAGTGTITLFGMATYGQALRPGDKLVASSSPAAGTYTIDSILWESNQVVVAEEIPVSGTYTTTITQRPVDEEDVVWPALSERSVMRDRTGNGILLPGWRNFDHVNQLYHQVCAEQGVMLFDLQRMQYQFLEEKLAADPSLTTEELFDTMFFWPDGLGGGVVQFNHPNEEFFTYAYGKLVGKLAKLIEDGSLHKHRVL